MLPKIGHRKAKDVTRADVRDILRGIINRGSPVMANRTLEVVRGAFNWAIKEEIANVVANPAQRLEPPGEEKSRDRVLNEREIRVFWQVLDGLEMSPGVRLALRFILATGQRKGEAAAARWSDIDFDAAMWTIPAGHSKNKQPHRVPLSDLALSLLEQIRKHAAQSEFLFPSALMARPIRETAINGAIYRNRDAFGIPAFTPHDLRRTCATGMASMGIPQLTIGRVLNHIETGVTKVYDRYGYDSKKRRALDAWADRLSEIVGLKKADTNVASLEAKRPKQAN